MLREPEFTLTIDGNPWSGWKGISVSRSIERMGGAFSVDLAQKPEEGFLSAAMRAGLPVVVDIDGQVILDGYIDTIQHSYSFDDASIGVSGRDRTGDLIDCAAIVDGPFEFNNQKLERVIQQILYPYDIELSVDVDTGQAFGRLAVQPGETAQAFIDRACRYRAILPVSNGIGGLVLTRPANEKSAGKLVFGENLIGGTVTNDWCERFSLYVLKGQAEGRDESTGAEVSSGEGRATDQYVLRHRPTVITAESQGGNQTLQDRAVWQRDVSRARSNTASYTVKGWYADEAAKILWKPNTLVKVKDEARSLNREMLIVSLSFDRDGNNGTTTNLELAIPEAYQIEAEIEPSSGSGGTGKGGGAVFDDYDLLAIS